MTGKYNKYWYSGAGVFLSNGVFLMKKVDRELVDKIMKDVLIENNINWTHTEEIGENLYDEHRLPITHDDIYDIIDRVVEILSIPRK